MSSSNPRSSRIKKSVLNNDFGDLNKTKPFNKKKKQIRSKKDNNALDPDYRLQYVILRITEKKLIVLSSKISKGRSHGYSGQQY